MLLTGLHPAHPSLPWFPGVPEDPGLLWVLEGHFLPEPPVLPDPLWFLVVPLVPEDHPDPANPAILEARHVLQALESREHPAALKDRRHPSVLSLPEPPEGL